MIIVDRKKALAASDDVQRETKITSIEVFLTHEQGARLEKAAAEVELTTEDFIRAAALETASPEPIRPLYWRESSRKGRTAYILEFGKNLELQIVPHEGRWMPIVMGSYLRDEGADEFTSHHLLADAKTEAVRVAIERLTIALQVLR